MQGRLLSAQFLLVTGSAAAGPVVLSGSVAAVSFPRSFLGSNKHLAPIHVACSDEVFLIRQHVDLERFTDLKTEYNNLCYIEEDFRGPRRIHDRIES